MADKIVVMHDGRIEQAGTPLDLYDRPDNAFVATFIGSPSMNMIEGVFRRDRDAAWVATADGTQLPVDPGYVVADGRAVIYGLRPEHITIGADGTGIPANVHVVEPTGSETHVLFSMAGCQINGVFRERIANQPGATMFLQPDHSKISLFAADTGRRIASELAP